jgi:hypothetical protein
MNNLGLFYKSDVLSENELIIIKEELERLKLSVFNRFKSINEKGIFVSGGVQLMPKFQEAHLPIVNIKTKDNKNYILELGGYRNSGDFKKARIVGFNENASNWQTVYLRKFNTEIFGCSMRIISKLD